MAMTPVLHVIVQPRFKNTYRGSIKRTGNDSFVESTLAMATLFLLRTVVARSKLLLLYMYGARVRDF